MSAGGFIIVDMYQHRSFIVDAQSATFPLGALPPTVEYVLGSEGLGR